MESPPSCLSCAPAHDNGAVRDKVVQEEEEGQLSQVDPFLVEALENPRHRLTVLRMELDIQRFMQNSDLHQFEFQHFPTSYLRCAAHRVAQHYGLQTLALDSIVDGSGSRVVARKTPESRYPAVCLSDFPTKQPENEKTEQVKIVIRPRPNRASLGSDAMEPGTERSPVRSVEERKEEYHKARARIFSVSCIPEVVEGHSLTAADDGRSLCSNGYEQEPYDRTAIEEHEKIGIIDGASRVAIFRDREKDRTDPDYDRSYDRYVRGFVPCHDFSFGTSNVLQPSFVQYEPGFAQLGQLPRAAVSYRPSGPVMSLICAVGCNQTSPNALYMQWPTPAMMYAHSYEHFRGAIYQAPVYQQPLSFEHWQNH